MRNLLFKQFLMSTVFACSLFLPALSYSAEPEIDLDVDSDEILVEEPLPFSSLPYAARMELNESLLTIWEFVDKGGDIFDARQMLSDYLRSPAGKAIMAEGSLEDSYMFYVLLMRSGLLAGMIERMDLSQNKGLHWFAHGLLRIFEKKSAQASGNFAKGIFSSLQVNEEDYLRLSEFGIDVKYFPSMTPYSNAAFLAGRFFKMPYRKQEQVLNVAIADKVSETVIIPSEIFVRGTASYQLQALYFNLGVYLVLEGYNDLYAVQDFVDEPDDLFNILQEFFGYDSREIFKLR